MIIIETFERGCDAAHQPTAAANRDQDRYVMITSQSRFKMPILLAGAGPPRQRSHKYPPSDQTVHRSSSLKADTCACSCYRGTPRPILTCRLPTIDLFCRAQIPIARDATPPLHFPRFRSLKAFGRRPRCKPHRRDRPASETLNIRDMMRCRSVTCDFRFAPKADTNLRQWQLPSEEASFRWSHTSNRISSGSLLPSASKSGRSPSMKIISKRRRVGTG